MSPLDIRYAVESDVEAMLRIYNHYVASSPATFDVDPLTLEARREWFRGYAETGPYRILVATENDALVGSAWSSRFRYKAAYSTTVETTIYLDPAATGRGIGARLYASLFEALDSEDLHRAVAGITLPNPASVALHERLGFRALGTFDEVGHKFGRYWSVGWFEKRLT